MARRAGPVWMTAKDSFTAIAVRPFPGTMKPSLSPPTSIVFPVSHMPTQSQISPEMPNTLGNTVGAWTPASRKH